MMEQEYVVTLKPNHHTHEFWHHMENHTHGVPHVPDRCVCVVHERWGSDRVCHYALTPSEAEHVAKHPHVESVEPPLHAMPHVSLKTDVIQFKDYRKINASAGNLANWGLKRCVSATNNYGLDDVASGGYPYTLDGTGVDVVITDSGIQVDHPEFQDAQGVSRVQQIDWYEAAGMPGTQSVNFYRDWDGHGTHVAAICAGKTFGWARNAHIYAIKIAGLEGTGDSGTGITVTDAFDVIRLWHVNKPVNPLTGVKRPTVVNMSWGVVTEFVNILGGNYRGTTWSGVTPRTDYGMMGSNSLHGVRVNFIDVGMSELIDAGILVCVSAGNYRQKIDTPVGADYDNYWTRSGVGNIYYHRGGSPMDDRSLRVGATDTQVADVDTDQKATYSDAGPGVHVWAPGTFILSACSTQTIYVSVSAPYDADPTYVQACISGTSMAAPQVAGMVSLYLQLNPWATPTQVKNWILNQSQSVIYTTGSDTDYTNNRSLLGSPNSHVLWPFNSDQPLSTQGDHQFQAVTV
jgi:subtilisin family serine protease